MISRLGTRLELHVVANYGGQIWRAVMNLVFVPLYIEYLGVEAYGVVGLFTLMLGWLQLLDVGMRPTLAREMARFKGGAYDAQAISDLLRTIEVIAASLAVVAASGIWIASDWLATDWLRSDAVSPATLSRVISIMGLVSMLRFLENLYNSALTGLRRQVAQNVAMSILATVRGGGAALVLVFGLATLEAFFVFQGLVSLLSVITLAGLTYTSIGSSPLRATFSLLLLKRVWKFATGMLLITVLALLLTQVDKVILSRLLSLEEFGYYTIAGVVAGALYTLVNPIVLAYYPHLTELITARQYDRLAETYHRGSQLVTVVLASGAAVLSTSAAQILYVWTSDSAVTTNSAQLVSILAIGTLLNGLVMMPYHLQLAAGWTSLALWMNAFAVVALVPSIIMLVPRYGPTGAAWLWAGLNFGYLLVEVSVMHRRLLRGEALRWYIVDVGMPAVVAFIAAGVLHWALPFGYSRIQDGVLLVATGGVVLISVALAAPYTRHAVLHRFSGRTRASRVNS